MADGVLSPPTLLAATTPDPLNMNTPDFSLTPSTVATTNLATPNSIQHVPQSSAAKPAKKRKSWGQALPEPKTNLPPRKRAKTADEKEQRRIERIKRNRAAAHNSRERKRQEAERLEVENHALKQQINALHQQLAQKDVTLDKCKDMIPGGLPELTQEELANIKVPEESIVSPSSSYDTIDPRASLAPSSINEDYMTPSVKMEPMSPASQMHLPPSAVHRTSISLDPTQHSAAMLCDLQCRSSETHSPSRWSQIIIYLMHLNIMTFYKSLMVASWTLWPTRMATMMKQVSATLTTSSNSMTCTRTTRRTQGRLTAATTSSTSPTTASRTLFLLLSLLSHRLPTSATSAQLFATGPKVSGVSALQALPTSESESKQEKEVFERDFLEMVRQVAANGYSRRSGSKGGTLGSWSEERKDSGGIE
ncbi:hypothetical protein M436DRAFT_53835 [Aureobasidium namibiae CBS 147.97]|uniref:BZIP domain-containing protein n=1 Tax=Aureobasidium namibiae CBS 147.97 TaxID=1043004 RepID=A0A074WL42_9PEZI|nr:uncharacterized protein M436DRAFT_53835 [Aureobasidium namibiae CBS 147.97]KEQ70527.1 hypothetical protein M436DRAFT_53835 [Aureobasidium namibiae CBS 147.97]